MLTPFQVHAALAGQTQAFLGGGAAAGGALLTLFGVQFACTHSEVIADFELMPGGRSSTTVIEQCEFLASAIAGPVAAGCVPGKGQQCQLVLGPGVTGPGSAGQPLKLQLWAGGLIEGGLMYRFMLVSASYKAG